MHGEYILTQIQECVPSPFTTRGGTHSSLRHPGSVWPFLFAATENNNKYRENTCLRGKHESGEDGEWWGRGRMVRMATKDELDSADPEESGLPFLHLSSFHLSPCLGAKIKCPDVPCWQRAGSGPCPLQPPATVCKENQKARKWLGRDGGAWQDQLPLAPPASRPPRGQPSATPGKQLHP